jgi:hypothetical protein
MEINLIKLDSKGCLITFSLELARIRASTAYAFKEISIYVTSYLRNFRRTQLLLKLGSACRSEYVQ